MAYLKGQTDDVPDPRRNLVDELGRVQSNDVLAEDSAAVVGTMHHHTVEERLEVELFEQGGFGVTHPLAGRAHLVLLGDLDLGLLDLSGDLQGVEKVDLGRVKAGCPGWDDVVDRGGGANLSLGGELALLDLALEVEDWLVGEDESDLVLQVWEEGLELGLGCSEILKEFVVLLIVVERFSPERNNLVEECLIYRE